MRHITAEEVERLVDEMRSTASVLEAESRRRTQVVKALDGLQSQMDALEAKLESAGGSDAG